MTITLVAALIVSMSLIPLIAFGLVRAPKKPEKSIQELWTSI